MSYRNPATVERWIDGDTAELTVHLPFHLTYRDHFRLAGIDTPERGYKGAAEATARVNELAPPGTVVDISTIKADKYGRWLAYMWPEGEAQINSTLVNEGLAVPYSGGAKNAN